jgi:uncharacterized RDD family membrane protein YckC
MDDDTIKDAKTPIEGQVKYVLPPPNIPKPAAPIPVVEGFTKPKLTQHAPSLPGDASARVNLRKASAEAEEDEDAGEELASFNSRFMAGVIDLVVASGLAIGLMILLPSILDSLGKLVGVAYMVTRDSLPFLGGQSVGKKAMKIRALTQDGKVLTGNWEASLIRSGVLIIPFFAFLELYILLTREEKPEQGYRLGDEWAKTKVIVEKPVESPNEVE